MWPPHYKYEILQQVNVETVPDIPTCCQVKPVQFSRQDVIKYLSCNVFLLPHQPVN